MPINRQHAQNETANNPKAARNQSIHLQFETQNRNRGAEQRGRGIHVGAKHPGHLAYQQIADRPSAYSGNTTHHRGQQRIQFEFQRLACSRDGEKAKAGRIERDDQPVVDSRGMRTQQEDRHAGGERHRGIMPVADCAWWYIAYQQVAHDPTSQRRHEGQHQHPKQIKPGFDRCRRAFSGEQRSSHEVNSQQQMNGARAKSEFHPSTIEAKSHWRSIRNRPAGQATAW